MCAWTIAWNKEMLQRNSDIISRISSMIIASKDSNARKFLDVNRESNVLHKNLYKWFNIRNIFDVYIKGNNK